jgi:hypothetical protein
MYLSRFPLLQSNYQGISTQGLVSLLHDSAVSSPYQVHCYRGSYRLQADSSDPLSCPQSRRQRLSGRDLNCQLNFGRFAILISRSEATARYC